METATRQTAVKRNIGSVQATVVAFERPTRNQIKHCRRSFRHGNAPRATANLKLGASGKNSTRWRKTFFDA
ncbi:hypothetical protein M3J09_011256 [Ascochyta lentis]